MFEDIYNQRSDFFIGTISIQIYGIVKNNNKKSELFSRCLGLEINCVSTLVWSSYNRSIAASFLIIVFKLFFWR